MSTIANKLHLQPGMKFTVVNAPAGAALVPGKPSKPPLDLVLLFALNVQALTKQWPQALRSLKSEGILWVAYPKKSSGIETDLGGMTEWGVTKESGWNPVSMISIDDTWSAVRFRHKPGLEVTRHQRQHENILDADGTVCVDRTRRIVTAPEDFLKLLSKNTKARTAFDALSFTHRKEYVVWIIGAKKAGTRGARILKAVDMLANGKKNPGEK